MSKLEEPNAGPPSDGPEDNSNDGETHTARDSIAHYARLFRYADPGTYAMYGLACISAIASGTAMPLMSIVFGSFTTKFSDFSTAKLPPNEFRDEINRLVLWFIWIFLARFVLTYVGSVLSTVASIRMTRAVRQAFLTSTLRQEIWYFDVNSHSSIATQVSTNGNKINQGTADKLFMIFAAISTFISAFVVAFIVQWKLALITMSCIPLIFIVTMITLAMDSKIELEVLQILSRGAVVVQETFASISTVQAFWAQGKMVEKYEEFLRRAHDRGNKKSPVLGVMFSIEYFCTYAAVALAFWQGYRMLQRGEIASIGTVFTVELSVLIAATSVSMIVPQLQALTSAAGAASELFSVIDHQSQLDPLDQTGHAPTECSGQIEVRNISFAYPARPSAQVVHDLTLSIPSGMTTAMVGPSGCGKSTLVGLLERWYVPQAGEILLDGVEISRYNTKWLRSRIRLVQQEPTLFSGTVFENIAMGLLDEQVALPIAQQMKLVQAACVSSNAHDFICKLPQGYDTELGESAGMLSGGQRQRLAIARSIISNPSVLLLDEATSALDPRAESIVQEALQQVSRGRTVLTIAHKLATIKGADNIAVLSAGRVVEEGTHQQLLDNDGHYAALVHAQDLGNRPGSRVEVTNDDMSDTDSDHGQIALKKTESVAQSVLEAGSRVTQSYGTVNRGLLSCIARICIEQRSLYPTFIIALIGVLIGGATYPGLALIFAKLVGVYGSVSEEASGNVNFYALMLFIVAIGNLVAYMIIGWTCNIIGQTVAHSYRAELFKNMLKQDREFFDHPEHRSASLVSRISLMPTQLQELVSVNVLLILIVVVNLLSSCILALAYGWKLALVVISGGLPPLLGSTYIRTRLEQKLGRDIESSFFESASLATEAVAAIKTIASLTQETAVLRKYSDMLSKIARTTVTSTLNTMFWAALSQSLEFLMMALGFWYGGQLLANGEYTAEQFFIIFIAVLFSGQAAAQFTTYSTSISKAASAANYIFWLRTQQPSIVEDKINKDRGPSEDDEALKLQSLQFRYSQRSGSRVLRGVSMTIEQGQSVAFVGASGCGKSTMISLLERLYDPTSGCIFLGDTNIANMSPRRYRQSMSLVLQQPVLFRGSILENITLSLEEKPTDNQVEEACRQANALEFIQSLPEGLNTLCGSQGLQFSGGQRQRIAIARALIRNPKFLLLDEATSALDTQSERLIQQTLNEAAATRTTISVAHRLSTVRNADAIYVFADGRIKEAGTHEELVRQKGIYHSMCLMQSLDNASP